MIIKCSILDKIITEKCKGADKMMADIAWNVFKKTGDINMYLEFKKIKKLKEDIKGSSNETNKVEWSDFS